MLPLLFPLVLAAVPLGSAVALRHVPLPDASPAMQDALRPLEAPDTRYRLWAELIVRARVTGRHLQVLTDEVDRIWAPYGVTAEWRDAPPDSIRPAGFTGWVRVLVDDDGRHMRRPRDPRRPTIAAVHAVEGRYRNVIYVSLEGARALLGQQNSKMLRAAQQDRLVARLAGRAVAHELGHYLLQSSGHTDEGLMRAAFTPADVLAEDLSRFRLTPQEVVRLAELLWPAQRAILARKAPAGHD